MTSLWNGTGGITRSNGTNSGANLWAADRDAGTKITASNHDTHDQNIIDTILKTLNLDGENSPSTNIPWGNNRITGLAAGVSASDASNVGQIAAQPGTFAATDTGSANTYVIALTPPLAIYTAGQVLTFIAANTNFTSCTLDAGPGVKDIKDAAGADILPGGIEAGVMVEVKYDGTQFVLNPATSNRSLRAQAGSLVVNLGDDSADPGPRLDLKRFSASPADDDEVGEVKFRAQNDAAEDVTYGRMFGITGTVADAAETGSINFEALLSGAIPAAPYFSIGGGSAAGTFTADSLNVLTVNRTGDDGALVTWQQDGTTEGTITVLGSTISYNGFQGSHYAEWADPALINSPPSRGTWLETTDEPFQIPGPDLNHEGLCKVRVAQAGSKRVCGAYLGDLGKDGKRLGILIAAVGGPFMCRTDGPIDGGDFVEIGSDGIARRQSDDIRRSTTAGKVWRGDDEDGDRLVSITFECGG